jgi:hypothetical protein
LSRPGFVLEVDERTPPLLVHEGEKVRLETFPLGTRVVYPPESLPGLPDVDAAIRDALLNPLGSDPLPELLFRGMRLTIAFDDISLPLPQMRTPTCASASSSRCSRWRPRPASTTCSWSRPTRCTGG